MSRIGAGHARLRKIRTADGQDPHGGSARWGRLRRKAGTVPAPGSGKVRAARRRREYGRRARLRRYARSMSLAVDRTRLYVRGAAEALAETLWPTRCAVCDEPGELLCGPCRLGLPYIDWWRACPRCGAPFGRVQCSECNPVMLGATGRTAPPFASAASAVSYESAARRLVTTYKDRGERRLAGTMAALMAPYVAPGWRDGLQAVTFVPATPAARRRRGFDHAELLAQAVAEELGIACIDVLRRPHSFDQRRLSRAARLANMEGSMQALPGATLPRSVLLVDDVCTTGATLFAASEALREAGAACVRCLTFARAW